MKANKRCLNITIQYGNTYQDWTISKEDERREKKNEREKVTQEQAITFSIIYFHLISLVNYGTYSNLKTNPLIM